MNEMSFLNTAAQVTENLIKAGESKSKLPLLKIFLMGIFAGMFIACGATASSVAMHEISNVGLARLVGGAVFPVGFMMVVLIGGELFTGDCLMIMGAMRRSYKTISMIRVLFLVFLFNLIGGIIIAALIFFSGQLNYTDGLLGAYTIKCALSKVELPFGTAFVSGILCNIFVCFAVIMAGTAKDAAGKILASFFPIMAFVVGGFEHCVANMYYIPAGIFAATNGKYVEKAMTEYGITAERLAKLNWKNFFLANELPVTLGNIAGGMLFVGVILYFIYKNELRAEK